MCPYTFLEGPYASFTILLFLEMLTNFEWWKAVLHFIFVLDPVNYAVSPAIKLQPVNLKFL